MVDKLREIFETLNNIGIILHVQGMIFNNPLPEGIIILIDQLFVSLRLSFTQLV